MLASADKAFTEMLKERGLPGHLRYEMCVNVWGALLKEWRAEVATVQSQYTKLCEEVLKAGLDKYERSRCALSPSCCCCSEKRGPRHPGKTLRVDERCRWLLHPTIFLQRLLVSLSLTLRPSHP